jgi:UDP-glucuronate 4-epimerase
LEKEVGRNILVTGAAGFIGSHTCRALLAVGDTVVGVDNLNDYYDPTRKRANLQEVRASTADLSTFTFEEADVRDRSAMQQLFSRERFDAVVHLAAMAGVRVSVENPYLYYDVNLTGTLVLLDAARANGLPPFVLASTSSVFGQTKVIPFVETDPCDRPLAPYAASKRAAEMLAYTYHHLYGQRATVLRFFTVYGPRGRPDMMAYKVLDNIFHQIPVPIYRGGQMHRDWTYIDDIVAGILGAVDRPQGYEVVNLGRGQPVLLADFVRLIEEVSGRRAELTPASMPETDIAYTFADISKARALLGYNPQTSVDEGVRQLWEWYRVSVLEHL